MVTGDDMKYEGEWKVGLQDGVGIFSWYPSLYFSFALPHPSLVSLPPS